MGRHGNGAWTVFVTERKLLLGPSQEYNELLDFGYSTISFSSRLVLPERGSFAAANLNGARVVQDSRKMWYRYGNRTRILALKGPITDSKIRINKGYLRKLTLATSWRSCRSIFTRW